MAVDQHGDNAKRRALANSVSEQEIAHFYHHNLAQFQRIDPVEAEYWLFDTNDTASSARLELIEEAVSKTELHRLEIEMGKVNELSATQRWISNLAAARPLNELSPVVRMPNGQWILLKVTDKTFGHYPLESETVRYQAKKQLAVVKAHQEFDMLRKELGLTGRSRFGLAGQGQNHEH